MTKARRAGAGAILAGVALAVAWRLPFSRLPITTDEAGYMVVAHLWGAGAPLYRGIWVDRPQGLLLVFRLVWRIGGASTATVRAAAIAAGALLVIEIAAVARATGSRERGMVAALLAGALGCSPFLESFTLSGELLAAVVSTAAVYFGLRWSRGGSMPWLLLAGLAAGCAVMVKQSAFDGGFAVVALVLLQRPPGWRRALLVFTTAAAAPVLAAAAASGDPGAWWFAVVGYRGSGDSIVTGPLALRRAEFWLSASAAVKGIGPLLACAATAITVPELAFCWLWLAGAAVGVIGGGQFHPHYYIQLIPPLTVLAAAGLARLWQSRRRPLALVVVGCALAVATITGVAPLGRGTRASVKLLFPEDLHLSRDLDVARRVARLTTPSQSILVVPSVASVYFLARRRPAVSYLWVRNLVTIARARKQLRVAVATAIPAAVVVDGPLVGVSGRALRRRYRVAARADGAMFYLRRPELGRRGPAGRSN